MSITLDKYHLNQGEASTKIDFPTGKMSDASVRFYATQRKLFAAPVVGHERFLMNLIHNTNVNEHQFLIKNGFGNFANSNTSLEGIEHIRAACAGRIMFGGQPFLDISGKFLNVQAQEITVEHAFDMPMTVASRAMDIKRAAKNAEVMDFSLRRDGDKFKAQEVALYSYIGGFDQTSNGDAAYKYNIPWVGTMAHFWVQMFIGQHGNDGKHFQQIAFEKWLDTNPNGTLLLIDTINLELGIKHAINAAKSSAIRLKAFKGVRIDSGNLLEGARLVTKAMMEANIPLEGFIIALTGDLDAERISMITDKTNPDEVRISFGVGTKLISEIDRVAGVIYKLCEVEGNPVLKVSDSLEKATLPSKLQVLRGIAKTGFYVGDITCLDNTEDYLDSAAELMYMGAVKIEPLLHTLFYNNRFYSALHSPKMQREFVNDQLKRFGYLMNYPTKISRRLNILRHKIIEEMNKV